MVCERFADSVCVVCRTYHDDSFIYVALDRVRLSS